VESAQKRVEGTNFDARKTILSFADALREQREFIYKQRFGVIDDEENVRDISEAMINNTVHMVVETHTQDDDEENWNYQAIVDYVQVNLLEQEDVSVEDLRGKDPDEMQDIIMDKVDMRYDEKEEELSPEQMREFEKVII